MAEIEPENQIREPRRDEVVTQQDIEFHRATASDYDERITATYRIYHEFALLPVLDELPPNQHALDIGCGTGAIALELAARGNKTLGLDHSPEMLAIARNRAQALGVETSLELREADAMNLPLDDGEMDFVSCQGVLHHLPTPELCLREMERVLRPGGTFFISEPCKPVPPVVRMWERFVLIVIGIRRRIRGQSPPQDLHGGDSAHEAPIAGEVLLEQLDALGLQYEARYLSHLALLERILPDKARLLITRLVSAPWRNSQGTLIFITGCKPQAAT